MTTYGITDDGFVIKPLSVIRQEIDDELLSTVDPGLDLSDRSVLGQVNGVIAGALAEVWELGQAVYNAAYPDSASGASLDNVCSLTGTSRSPTTKTLVPDVSVTLSPNTTLPVGSVAHLTNQPNARFLSLAEVVGGAAGGVFTVDFEAETAGETVVAIGQLDQIAEPVTGWTAVNNTVAGETGDETETDAELRTKRLNELEAGGSTSVNAIRANLLQNVDGIISAIVFENDTDIADGLGRPPHSIHCVIRGGTAADIAEQIFESKAAGIATYGDETETVTDSAGYTHDINFDFATELDFYCDIEITVDSEIWQGATSIALLKANIAAYVNGLGIGGDVIYDLVKCAAFETPGVLTITAMVMDFSDPPSGTSDLTVDETEVAISDVANIGVDVD